MAAGQVYSISAARSFVDALAAHLLDQADQDRLALADMLILLPTRRACRALREAFLRLGQGKALVLPVMQPIGDVDEEELVISAAPDSLSGTGAMDIPPAIGGLRRQLLLSRLIMMRPDPNGILPGPDQAARLAAELARLLDQVQTELNDLSNIENLVRSEFSEHWQLTVDFLDILRRFWPDILSDEGVIDPAQRRNLLLAAQNEAWIRTPPRQKIIAAGSTGSVPATRGLLKTISELPNGSLVLPGLDRHLDEESWQAVGRDETHPQHGLHILLDHLQLPRSQVSDWPRSDLEANRNLEARIRLIAEALRPAETTDAWREIQLPTDGILDNLQRLDCPTQQLEAASIALMMRQTLEDQDRTAALVTPDRTLARRVTAELGRWGLVVDDSAGVPLNAAPPVVFLRLLAETVVLGFSPISLLALLKHPLAALGQPVTEYKRQIRLLERHLLRGTAPRPGLDGLQSKFQELVENDALPEGPAEQIGQLLTSLKEDLAPLEQQFSQESCSFEDLLESHLAAAEALARDDALPGAERIWAGEAGEAFVTFLTELKDSADLLQQLDPREYPALMDSLMLGRAVRPRYGQHPRLFILGPLEARLHQADTVILGGLNEGIWPPEAKSDPWMSRPMRKAMGLPLPEHRIGLSAHDFSQAFGAEKVILTRSEKNDGQPTVPSRWLSRLDVVLQALELEKDLVPEEPWLKWAELLGRAEGQPVTRPEPRPPVAARPRKLSVTRVEAWMRDPYTIYAQKILDLNPLEDLEAEPGMAERGTFIHAALEEFVTSYPDALPQESVDKLLNIGEKHFGSAMEIPAVRTFWWPRFKRIAQWFVDQEGTRRQEIARSLTEIWGSLILQGPAGPFTLTAKADRIDTAKLGGHIIIDYKTGSPPSDKLVRAGVSPQMPLEAAIAAGGGFDGLPAGEVSALEFWRLSGGEPAGERKALKNNAMELAEEALAGLGELIARFDDPNTPYQPTPRPKYARAFNDYEHLAREKEWRVAAGEEGE